MKKIISIISMAVLFSILTGCAATATPTTAASTTTAPATDITAAAVTTAATAESSEESTKKKVIGVSLFYRRDEWYKDVETGFILEAEKAGYEVIIQDADADPAKQTQQVEDFVSQGVCAIALSGTDPDGLVPAVEAANAKGIPVFTFDGPINTDVIIAHVGYNERESGMQAGQWVVKYVNDMLGGKAKVAIIDFPQSAVVCKARADGFIEAIKGQAGIEIVAQQDGKATRTDSMAVMENILTSNPDVDVVYGINYDTGAGALSAIQAGNGKAIVVCNAWGVEAFEQLAANDPVMKAIVASDPSSMTRDTIKAIDDYLAGKPVEKTLLSSTAVYDSTNIKDLAWQEIIAKRGE